MMIKKRMNYFVIYKKEKDGGYTAVVPSLPGCISYGNTLEEAKANIMEAIEGYLEVRSEIDEDLKADDSLSVIDSVYIKNFNGPIVNRGVPA